MVPFCDQAISVHANKGVKGGLNDQAGPFLALLQCLLGLFAGGDVGGNHQTGVSASVNERMRGNLDVDQRSVFLAMFPDPGEFGVRRSLRGAR